MKRLLTLALFAVLLLPAVAQELTVATYNIRNANKGDAERGNGWERRCPWVCGLIEFQGFDIFGSQEVLDGQLHDMLAQLPDYAYIGVGRDDGKAKGEYSPIFYKKERFRLLDEGHFWLSEVTDRPNKGWDAALPRICTWGHFLDRQTRRRFWFFNLHMDHVGVRAREESAKLVVAKIREMCGPREFVILTGDFNVDQNNPIYTTFTASGVLADSYETAARRYAPNGTFNNFNPTLKTDSRIDHIFVSPSVRVHDYGVLTDTYRSQTTRSDEVAEQIKIARGFGDLSENSEYDEAKNEQGKLYSRIAELEVILQHVVIVDESAASDAITIGCTVTVQGADGKEASYKIVGSQESDPMHGIISEESPFGKAFLGAKEGQEVVVEAPFGNIRYTVKKIER